MRIIIDPDAGKVKGNSDADFRNVSYRSLGDVSAERALGALMLVLRDKVNALRGLLPIPLAAESVDDWIAAWKGKL